MGTQKVKGLEKLHKQIQQIKDMDFRPALQKGGYVLQREIQTNHDYINRTGALQANEDTVITDEGVEVQINQEYAWYVELKKPFVRPAIDEKSDEIVRVVGKAIQEQLKREVQ